MPQSLKSGKPPENFAGRPTNFSPKFSDGKKKIFRGKKSQRFFSGGKVYSTLPLKNLFSDLSSDDPLPRKNTREVSTNGQEFNRTKQAR